MELNFAFLRAGAVRWYRPRAKSEKCQKRIGFDVQSAFKILYYIDIVFITDRGKSCLYAIFEPYNIWARFRPLYRQSERFGKKSEAFYCFIGLTSFRLRLRRSRLPKSLRRRLKRFAVMRSLPECSFALCYS